MGGVQKETPCSTKNPVAKNDLAELIADVQNIFDEFLQDSANDVRLCISNEMHGFLLAEADGMPVTDYILRMLSGIQPPCHLTNAAATGLVDLNLNDWNKKLLEVVSPDGVIFPKIDTQPVF